MRSIRWLPTFLALGLAVPADAAQTRAYVLTSDFSNGGVSVVDLDTHGVQADVATVHSDARARWYQGKLYVVNRFGQDNIQVIDPAQGYATIRQFSVGNGSNPQDIAFVSPTKAYVTRLGSPNLLRVNPATGDTLGPISLARFADADGLPEMDYMIRVGNRLYVGLQRLVNFAPADSSLIAVIDTDADTLIDAHPAQPGIQAITLRARNPVTPFGWDRSTSRLLVGCVGNYGVLDGGVEWVDPRAMRSDGYAITEAGLGGDVLDLVWRGAGESYAIVSDASFNTSLVAWSAITGTTTGTLFAPGGFSLADVERNDRDELYVCRNDPLSPGVYVFSAATHAPLAGPLGTGLPPQVVTFDVETDAVAGAPMPAKPQALRLAAARPNPARSQARLALSLERAARVRGDVIDAAGRLVRSLGNATLPAGAHEVMWGLDDGAGRPVGAGLYFVRVRVAEIEAGARSGEERAEREASRRVVVVR